MIFIEHLRKRETCVCMAKKIKKKVLLVICEGLSDDVTIHKALNNFAKKQVERIQVEITDGDIAYKEDIDEDNCVEKVVQIVKNFKTKNFLYATDFFAVVHIIDTDGVFMRDSSIIEDKNVESPIFSGNNLLTPNKELTIERFHKKQKIYKKLLEKETIENVKYFKFYFSRNLEHALYDKPNATMSEKIALSNEFDKIYREDAEGFYSIMNSMLFAVPNDYIKSWEYILTNDNSINRCSNFIVLLDMIRQ